MRRANYLLLLAFALSPACSCSGTEDVPSGFVPVDLDSGMDEACIDEDGDGFGEFCAHRDCDDNDPEVTDLCFRCAGNKVADGCPCDEGTQPELGCEPPKIEDVVNGQRGAFVCMEGTRYCRNREWGACEAIGEYIFVPYE